MPKLPFFGLSLRCSLNDEEAMARVKAEGDHRAFARLVERWERPIWSLCARMTGDVHRGEDLKQETFARLFEKRKDYEPGGRFSTWLWRIALNVCYDELRRVERRRKFLSDATENGASDGLEECAAETPGPADRVTQLEEGDLVRQALLQLPEIYRSVLVLRHYEGLKLAKIAAILEIPEGTVNSRMAEALQRLSRILEPKLRQEKRTISPANPTIKPIEVFLL